jgi:hypothetical protein
MYSMFCFFANYKWLFVVVQISLIRHCMLQKAYFIFYVWVVNFIDT